MRNKKYIYNDLSIIVKKNIIFLLCTLPQQATPDGILCHVL